MNGLTVVKCLPSSESYEPQEVVHDSGQVSQGQRRIPYFCDRSGGEISTPPRGLGALARYTILYYSSRVTS